MASGTELDTADGEGPLKKVARFFLLIVSKREVQFSKVGSVESNILHFLWWIKILKKYFLKKDFKVTMILANWQSTKIFTNTMFLLRTGVFFLFRFYLGYLHHLIFFLSRNFFSNFSDHYIKRKQRALFSRLQMIALFEGISKTSIWTKLENSKWPGIGKILFNGSPEELVNTWL